MARKVLSATMKYLISIAVSGSPHHIEIDEARYRLIADARASLFEALFLEEKLDLVTENYYEYETELLSMASRMMCFHDDDYFSLSRERNLVSRRVVNLLTAGRMYLDQSAQHFDNIYGADSNNATRLRAEFASQHKASLGYRAMNALRNYVQHRGFPIQSVRFPQQRIEKGDDILLLHRVVPLMTIVALEDDGKFKASVLEELRAIQRDGYVDIRPLIRGYVEAIGKIHEKARELIGLDLKSWEQTLDDTVAFSKNEVGAAASSGGVAIIAERDDRTWEERIPIFKEFIQRRQALERKNCLFFNLRTSYASNEIRPDDT